jgi:hypothetical protein
MLFNVTLLNANHPASRKFFSVDKASFMAGWIGNTPLPGTGVLRVIVGGLVNL